MSKLIETARSPSSRKIAVLGTFPPLRCGLATFTADLFGAVRTGAPDLELSVVAVRPAGFSEPLSDASWVIDRDDRESYRAVALKLNAAGVDLVCVQHEFGIYGGPAGGFLLEFLEAFSGKIVTTCHTVLHEPDLVYRRVTEKLIAMSHKIIVMAEKGRCILQDTYGAPREKIEVIPHGVPAMDLPNIPAAKRALRWSDDPVIMTFGLIGRGKGLETMVKAMPAIVEHVPTARYVIVGATHPNILAHENEAYREELAASAAALGVEHNVRFVNAYLDEHELLMHLAACDIYVTPYPRANQITSGTLAFASALGKPVVATPYWHASELLSNGRGALCEFNDHAGFANAIVDLLTNHQKRERMAKLAYAHGLVSHWPNVGARYNQVFETVLTSGCDGAQVYSLPAMKAMNTERVSLDHLALITDDTGVLQHAKFEIADRSHGYCLDDNARGLLLTAMLQGAPNEQAKRISATCAAFVQSAWNPDAGRYRNFMDYSRRWLDDTGCADVQARTLHALAVAAGAKEPNHLQMWAREMFDRSIGAIDEAVALRASGHAINALACALDWHPDRNGLCERMTAHANFLMHNHQAAARPEWPWFEPQLGYENALLPAALLRAALVLRNEAYLRTARDSLEWIVELQTGPTGRFRPVGNQSFNRTYAPPSAFDQQPIEAYATIAACSVAAGAGIPGDWKLKAQAAYAWFAGANDLHLPLADPVRGACCDGLHAEGVNGNMGAESTLAYTLSSCLMQEMLRRASSHSQKPSSGAQGAIRKPAMRRPIALLGQSAAQPKHIRHRPARHVTFPLQDDLKE